jgi:hypothetical protein
MPLQIEILYNEYNLAGAFAVAALLVLLGLVTLVAKTILERRHGDELAASAGRSRHSTSPGRRPRDLAANATRRLCAQRGNR